MRRWTNLAAGVALGVLLSVALYVGAAPTGVFEPARIGVVDFARLLEGYEKMKDAEAQFLATQKSLREEADKRAAEIQSLSARLAMHTPGSDAYTKTEKEILQRKAEYDTWTKMKTGEILDREKNVIRELYLDLEKAAGDYARANKLSLVLKSDKVDLSAPSVSDLHLMLRLKKVLYFSSDVDITDRLLATLNADYRKQKASGTPRGGAK
jgi:Skp family chaperone for outer membrane proteins